MPAPVDTPPVYVEARRARRFAIVAPVRFRVGDGDWLEGTTVNIGRLGLLICTKQQAPAASTAIEFVLALPLAGTRGYTSVACRGSVVRVAPSPVNGETLLAATIDDFRIEPATGNEHTR